MRAGLDEFARLHRGALLEVLAEADRVDAPRLGLHLADLGELLQRGHAGLVGHEVLAVAHGLHAQRRAFVEDRGADDELDGLVLQEAALVVDTRRAWEALRKLRRKVILGRIEAREFSPSVQHALRLAVDVIVVDADDGEAEGAHGSHP